MSLSYELRKKFKKKLQKEGLKKTCHLCDKELIIKSDDVIFMIEDKSVHWKCWRKRTNGK